jgi:hypothetical protein
MAGLTNQYVNGLGEILCGKTFLGVYSSDIQPKLRKRCYKFSVIFNLDKHTESGSHFVAIFCNKNTLFYFDPFGKKCTNKQIKRYIQNNLKGRKYIYNCQRIQNDKSLFCGLFCLTFLYSQVKNISFCSYLNNFVKRNTLVNDKIVTKMIVDKI